MGAPGGEDGAERGAMKPTQERIDTVLRMLEIQRTMKRFYGAEYDKKMELPRKLIRMHAEFYSCGILEASIAVMKEFKETNPGNEHGILMFTAAAVDLI